LTTELKNKIAKYGSEIAKTIELIEKLSEIEWSVDTAKSYCEKQGMQITDAMVNQLIGQPAKLETLNNFKYDEIFDKLNSLKIHAESLDRGVEHDEYNQVYKSYIENLVSNTSQVFVSFHRAIMPSHGLVEFLSVLFTQLNHLLRQLNPNLNELYEHFKYGNKNYVIFGKNGAGKTTLLKRVSEGILQKNSIVVPADRQLRVRDDGYTSYQRGISFNNMLADSKSIEYLTREINYTTKEEYDNRTPKECVLTTRFYSIFEALGLERNIVADRENLFLSVGGANKYSISAGSDGERSIAYLIMAILLAPQNFFIFIDEPERHLNGALMRNLFSKLEEERPDLCFIYLTHITDFVESRKNVELIYLEKTNIYGTWSFKKLDDFSDISLDVILSIEGANENIIFCEGDNRSSIDCKILECVYPDCEIKPVGSCEQVKTNTKGINGRENIFRRKAFGLVDDDYMSAAEIDALRADKVFTIGFNEWENLLICSELLEKVNAAHLSKDLAPIKSAVITFIKHDGKNAVLSDFITKRYAKIILADKISYGADLSARIEALNLVNKNILIDAVNQLEQKITNSTDYDELVSVVPAKMLLNMVAQRLGLNKGDDYIDMIVKLLKTDSAISNMVKNKLNITFI